jgi:hypothetical protein
MKRLLTTTAAAVVLLLSGSARGQDPEATPAPPQGGEAAPRVEYEKKTVINFEDDTIEGDLKRPDGEYVESRKKVQHSNLIRIREDWRDKVMQASGDL